MSTVLLPMNRPVRPPPLFVGGGADEPVLPLGTRRVGTPPPFVVVVPSGAWLVGAELLPLCAAGVPVALLDAPGRGPPPSLVAVVPAVVLDDVATACW